MCWNINDYLLNINKKTTIDMQKLGKKGTKTYY